MSNEKKPSKLPDLNEVMSMVGKFFNDMKASVSGISAEYQNKRSGAPQAPSKEKPKAQAAKPKAPTYKDVGRSEEEEQKDEE